MKKVIGKLVLLTLCALILGSVSAMADTPPPFPVNWQGVKAPMPQNLFWQAAASYNGKIYAFGGNEDNNNEVKTTLIYDIASNEWSTGADMPTGRYLATAVEVGGLIYVMGGRQLIASESPVNSNECYDPATNTWTTKAPMPSAIRGHAACAANGKIYVVGGNTTAYQNTVNIYDPVANSWTAGPKMPVKAAYGGAAYLPSKNRIYWVGGVLSSTPSAKNFVKKSYFWDLTKTAWDTTGQAMTDGTAYNNVLADDATGTIFSFLGSYWDDQYASEQNYPFNQALDAASGTWGFSADIPSPLGRGGYGCAAAANGKIYLIGGGFQFNEGGNVIKMVDVYSPSTDAWDDPNPVFPSYLSYNPATHTINGKIYIVGGLDLATNVVNDGAWELDPSKPTVTKMSGMANTPRFGQVSGVYNDTIVVASGADGNGDLTGTAEIYDPLADAFTPIANPDPNPTVLAAGAALNGKLYVFGGAANQVDSVKTRILDIAAGTWTSGPDVPVAMEQASATTVNGKIYIVGGYDGSGDNNVHDEIIIFDPATSSFTMGPKLPYAVISPAVTTWDNYVIVDGGSNGFFEGDVYFRPSAWLQIFDTTSSTWYVSPRLYGKGAGGCAMIGGTLYSVCGDEIIWPTNRVDVAKFAADTCTVTCNATATPASGTAPLDVTFTATSSTSNCTGTASYAWTFGDDGTSDLQNPTHTYAADGTYTWTMTVTVDGKTCSKTGTITAGAPVCSVTCEASATPASGLDATFAATYDAPNCTGTAAFAWTFGDDTTSDLQNATHTYAAAGTYNWTLTVTVDGKTCAKEGTVTVGAPVCTLICDATPSANSGTAPLNVTFTGTATPSAGCTGTPAYLWNFGDGSATSTAQSPTHTYQMGTWTWTLTVTVDGVSCAKDGTITVTGTPWKITNVKKLTDPFRLKIFGTKFNDKCKIYIDDEEVPTTTFKSSTLLVAKKGSALKAMCPKGETVEITVVNTETHEVTEVYTWTR